MNTNGAFLTCCVLMWTVFAQGATDKHEKHVLAGVVVSQSSSTPLDGVLVKVVELGVKRETDSDGRFEFRDMPGGNFTIGVHRVGYKTEHLRITVPGTSEVKIVLVRGYQFHEEITVTATPWADEPLLIPQQIDALEGESIEVSIDGSLARLVEDTSGVRMAYTGDSSAKPVIRGLTGNRILTLNDGISTNYQ